MGGNRVTKFPILYNADTSDFFNLGLGPMTNTLEATVTEERNGNFIFESKILVDDEMYPLIQENCIIKVDAGHTLRDQRFRVKRITTKDDGKAEIYAEHVSYLSQELALKPNVIINKLTANAALEVWKNSIIDANSFVVESDINTMASTKWRIDKVENPRQALGGVKGSLLDCFGGEYRFDNYHISLLKKRGKVANTLLAYGRNITDFEQDRNITTTYTSIYPYAIYTDDNQKEILVTIPEYVVDCPNIKNYPNRNVLNVDFSSEFGEKQIPTPARLKELAEKYIKNNEVGVPNVSIKLSFLDLSKTMDYADIAPLEELDLCDEVLVKFPKLGVNTTAKVIRTVWNVLAESYDEIEIGQKRMSLSNILSQQATSIKEIESNTNSALIAANGKNTVFYGLYGSDGLGEPKATMIGDMWYKPNGEETEFYVWNGTIWEFIMGTNGIPGLKEALKEVEAKVEQGAKDASDALVKANEGVDKATEASKKVDDSKLLVDSAVKDASDAMSDAKKALESFNSQATELNQTKDELSSKATKVEVDTLKGTVTQQGTQLTLTSNEVETKAEKSEVNVVKGTVDSVKAEQVVQAGKITSLTTRTDGQDTEISKLVQDYTGITSTIAKVQTDLNKKASSAEFSTLSQKVNSIQTTVGNKAEQSQVTQMAGQITSIVQSSSWQVLTGTVNFDDQKEQGKFFVSNGATPVNNPAPVGGYLQVERAASHRITQTYQRDVNNSQTYQRIWTGRAWSDWKKIADSLDIDGVKSQITQLNNMINLRVEKGDVVNQINISPKSILIAGKKIQITGDTYIASGVIKTAHIQDAAITDAKIGSIKADKITAGNLNAANVDVINLNVSKLVGNLSAFVRTYWLDNYGNQVDITGSAITLSTTNGGQARITSNKLEFISSEYSSGGVRFMLDRWRDSNGNKTSAVGAYIGSSQYNTDYLAFTRADGTTFMLRAEGWMNFGSNKNVVVRALNIYDDTYFWEPVRCQGSLYLDSSLRFNGLPGQPDGTIEFSRNNRTMNFRVDYLGDDSKSYFWFNNKIISSDGFASSSLLSLKNIKGEYKQDALSEICKTNIVEYAYKNRPNELQLSPIIDDVNAVNDYYLPDIIHDGKAVNLYAMTSMSWLAIQQLERKIEELEKKIA